MTNDEFQKSRDSESLLSLINLCRDNAINNQQLVKLYDLLDKQMQATVRCSKCLIEVCQHFMDSFQNIENRLKILEENHDLYSG